MSNFCQQGDITKIFIVDTGSSGTTGFDIYVTGGTYSNGTLTLGRNDGVNLLISGFLTGTTDTFITGGTYSEGVLILNRNDGVNISISGFSTTAIFTGNTSANCITNLYISNLHGCSPITVWDPINSLSSISATTYYGDGSNLTGIPDYYVTGGTYSSGTLTLNRQNGSVIITGITDNFVTGGTYSNGTLTLNRQNGSVTISGFLTGATGSGVDTFVTGFTFSSNTLTISQNQGQAPLTASITTIDLANIFSAVTFNIGTTGSISATTFYGSGSGLTGIPDYYVTGGTFSSGTLTLNRQNGFVTVTGITDNFVTGGTYSNGVLTLNRQNGSVSISGLLSADTYVTGFTFNTGTYDLTIFQNNGIAPLTQNLGILAGDITVTGGTYNPNNGVATFYNNAGGSFQVSGFLTAYTDIYLSSGSYNPNTGNLTLTRTDNVNVVVTGFTDYYVTGGTYSNGALILNRQNGSVTISGFLTGTTTDYYVTGGTYSNGTLTLDRQNGSLTVTGFLTGTTTDTYVTGFTYNGINQLTISQNQGQPNLSVIVDNIVLTGLTVNGSISATTYYGNGQYLTNTPDNYVTGGTYSSGTGTLTLNRQNGSVTISGFSTGGGTGGTGVDTYVTGFTYNGSNKLTISQNQGQTPLDVFVNTMTGLTITTGNLGIGTLNPQARLDIFDSTSNSILLRVSGDTTSDLVRLTQVGSGNTLVVEDSTNPDATPFVINNIGAVGIGANPPAISLLYVAGRIDSTSTIVATTSVVSSTGQFDTVYPRNSNTDLIIGTRPSAANNAIIFRSASGNTETARFTNNNNFLIGKSSDIGYRLDVSGSTNISNNLVVGNNVSALTVNVSSNLVVGSNISASTLNISSTSNLNGTINSTNLSGTGDRVVQVNSSGTFSATNQIISAYLTSGGTAANILENTNNWDINGVFIGSGITGTYQGQKHYNNNYFFEAVADNLFIRLIRG